MNSSAGAIAQLNSNSVYPSFMPNYIPSYRPRYNPWITPWRYNYYGYVQSPYRFYRTYSPFYNLYPEPIRQIDDRYY